ncbi:SnoaL-like domain-containing protein [Sphingomonas sp. CL5.1]|uniref:nuclear transport factor 2 family protein n=1 Tax=Sphingomonas sp. CL5.1 TaxID=2653203 RepID=UPI0015840A0E|nr:nuclear transport factor 2 family protein [Sphingomonas sp. CL5.1]QKR98329.1 SnoaL-like domain-containing protein [Sphingomonas sp. CL5.1]
MNDRIDPKAVVADFLATFSRGDVDGVLATMADGATWWVSGGLDGMAGTYEKATFGDLLRGATALYLEGALRITPTSMIAEGNRVAVEAKGLATMTNGRVYAPSYHFLFELAGDKILRVREYMDTMHAWETFFKP